MKILNLIFERFNSFVEKKLNNSIIFKNTKIAFNFFSLLTSLFFLLIIFLIDKDESNLVNYDSFSIPLELVQFSFCLSVIILIVFIIRNNLTKGLLIEESIMDNNSKFILYYFLYYFYFIIFVFFISDYLYPKINSEVYNIYYLYTPSFYKTFFIDFCKFSILVLVFFILRYNFRRVKGFSSNYISEVIDKYIIRAIFCAFFLNSFVLGILAGFYFLIYYII